MAIQTMYAGKANSPKATLVAPISTSETSIVVSDGSLFPAAPNIAVIGMGELCETILYAAKTDNILSSITRGVQGDAAEWDAGTVIARNFTELDYAAIKANIEDLYDIKLSTDGDGSDVTAAFEAAEARANIATGETLAVLFGKIVKWFTDLKALAFKDAVGSAEIDASAVTNAKLANMAAKTVKGNLGTGAATPGDVAMLDVTEYALDAATTATEVADAEHVVLSVSATSTKKITWANFKTALALVFARAYPFTTTLAAASWTGAGPYTQTVTVAGITAGMEPFTDVTLSATQATAEAEIAAWALISDIDTGANSVTFTCFSAAPTVNLNVRMRVVQ